MAQTVGETLLSSPGVCGKQGLLSHLVYNGDSCGHGDSGEKEPLMS